MSNHLRNETSPYLIQHAENPVDWYPWCSEAFAKAHEEDKPVFLSIGYSTCHWCHVMAHESFEDRTTAELLNKHFIAVKVDREERPDIDSVYMSVCQAFTGSGGWPMSIFMTWDKKPFLDDYAFYTAALTELYHSTLDKDYLEKAEQFCQKVVIRFADGKNRGFYLADPNDTELFMNPKESYDGAIPSGNSVMAYNLVRLHQLTEKEEYRELALKQMHYMSVQAQDAPTGHSMYLFAKLIDEYPPEHIAIALKHHSDLEEVRKHLPLLANVIVVQNSKEYPLVNDSTTFYICRNHTCLAPTNSL